VASEQDLSALVVRDPASDTVLEAKEGRNTDEDRVKLADNCGETYVRSDQVMGPGRVDKMTITVRRKKVTR
jgi:hypothetical protein